MIRRHGVPATLTSTGRVVGSWTPGEANALRGFARWHETYRRLRQAHSIGRALTITVAAWRHGVVLSGEAVGRR